MKDKDLNIDLTCHVLYSKACKKQIIQKIALHYPPSDRDAVWERVQLQYRDFLSDWRTDLGGKKNFHNGKGGNYDCIALMAYYVVCKDVTSLAEIEEMEDSLFLTAFRKLKFVDCNKPFFKKLMYRAFLNAKKQCDKWGDFKMNIAPFDPDRPIYYEFTECPVAEFAKKNMTYQRSCPRSATPILKRWSAFTPALSVGRPAQTAASAIIPFAATATNT